MLDRRPGPSSTGTASSLLDVDVPDAGPPGRARPGPAAAARATRGAQWVKLMERAAALRRGRARPPSTRERTPEDVAAGSSPCWQGRAVTAHRRDPPSERGPRAVRRTRSSSARVCSASWPGCSAEASARVAVVHPGALRATGRGSCARTWRRPAGYQVHLVEVPDGEDAKDLARSPAYAGRCSARPVSPASDAGRRARRGSGHRPGRVRRGDLAARRAGGAGADHACWPWSTPRSAARPAINTAEGKNLVGAFHPPAGGARATWRRSRRCRRPSSSAGWPRWSRPGSSPTRSSSIWSRPTRPPRRRPARTLRELVERAVAGQGRGGERRPARGVRPPRDPQLRPHARPRDRAGRAATGGATATRSRSGMVFAPSWPGRPAGSTTRRLTGTASVLQRIGLPVTLPGRPLAAARRRHARGQEGPRRHGCGSSCSTGWPSPAILDGPDPQLLRGRVRGGGGMNRCWCSTAPTWAGSGSASRRSTAVARTPTWSTPAATRPASSGWTSRSARPTTRRELIGWVHEAADAALPVVLNPAAFTHYSYALRDACAS